MILLRCPKFLRCLTADAGNFDRGHSLTSLPLPPAALSSLPTSARPTALLKKVSLRSRCAHRLWQSVPSSPITLLPKGPWHGKAVTGGFFPRTPCNAFVGAGFYPARSSAPLVTDAGRCGHRPLQNPIGKHFVGPDAPVRTPILCRPLAKTLSLRDQFANWSWQSAFPSLKALFAARKKGPASRQDPLSVSKSLAEFAARRRQRNKIIFSRDLCVRENTSQAASVEFVRL